METKGSIEFKLNQLDALDITQPVNVTGVVSMSNASISMLGIPSYADKATAEAALAPGQLYYITATGALGVALA
jgi:hypothetical protein